MDADKIKEIFVVVLNILVYFLLQIFGSKVWANLTAKVAEIELAEKVLLVSGKIYTHTRNIAKCSTYVLNSGVINDILTLMEK